MTHFTPKMPSALPSLLIGKLLLPLKNKPAENGVLVSEICPHLQISLTCYICKPLMVKIKAYVLMRRSAFVSC